MSSPSLARPRIRVLLIESDPWDAGLVQEALDELEEQPVHRLLPWEVELYHADSLQSAVATLARESFDVILLNLDLADSRHLHTYLRLRPLLRNATVIILCPSEEEHTALAAVREGAFTYLLKEDLDCTPLARLLRTAVERQQSAVARAELPLLDELTNLISRDGFVLLGEQSLQLAARWNRPATLFLIELSGLAIGDSPSSRQARDLALLETGDFLRTIFHQSDIVARLQEGCFGAICFGEDSPEGPIAHRLAQGLTRRPAAPERSSVCFFTGQATLHPAGPTHLDVLLESAERSLCENRRKAGSTQ